MKNLIQPKSKILNLSEMLQKAEGWRKSKLRIIFTNGCFDILHSGHVDYLAKAASLGDILVIGLNSDASVSRLKGKGRPVQNQEGRALVLASLGFVDAVTIFEEDTPAALIEKLLPDILVKGADYRPQQIAGADAVFRNGGSLVFLPYIKGHSTSEIILKIEQLK